MGVDVAAAAIRAAEPSLLNPRGATVIAEAVVAALSAAGRLLPDGGELQYGLRIHGRGGAWVAGAGSSSRDAAAATARYNRENGTPTDVVSRRVGPWTEVTE